MDLRGAVEGFCLAVAAERLSARTQRSYRDTLADFLAFTGNLPMGKLSPEHLHRYVEALHRRPGRTRETLCPSTVHKAYSVVRRFCRWAYQQELTARCVSDFTRAPRLEQPMKDTLTPDELERLLEVVSRRPRERALVGFFLDTGCRLEEVARLDLADVDLDQRMARVHGKGGREGAVPFGLRVRSDLHRYITGHRKAAAGETALFTGRSGARLGREGLSTLIRRLFLSCGISGRAHKLRHTFATEFLRSGGNLETLRRILRHRSILVTQGYLHLVNDDLMSEHTRHSPIDKLRVRPR